jgi:hypothetical protein
MVFPAFVREAMAGSPRWLDGLRGGGWPGSTAAEAGNQGTQRGTALWQRDRRRIHPLRVRHAAVAGGTLAP